ncbi:MAG TPA: F0F1 ATP synthase subunit B [Gemmatimonadales bacterium]|nr:F0F1 ATP synthase subunit B [Gemmatimonadales bacterium]
MRSVWLAGILTAFGATPLMAEGGGLLTVDGGLMVWTLVVFGLFFLILKRFAWPVVLGAVEAREKKLEEQLAQSAKDREDAARLLAEQQKLLADARGQVVTILNDAKVAAERERQLGLEKARAEADDLLARARREIAAEKDRAVVELRREAVDLALAAAGKLIGQRLQGEQDRKLVQDYLATLGPSK